MSKKKNKINSENANNKDINKEMNLETKDESIAKETDIQEEILVEDQVQENKQIENEAQKFNELNDKYLRLSAEFDNFRRRSLKEKMELIKSAGEDILINILPVVDNFERALKAIEEIKTDETNAINEGILLIYNNFKDFLSQRGVKELEALGVDFNTDHHEAISIIPAPQEDMKGKVIAVVEKGYIMHEKIIRFAKVVVGE